MLNNIYIFANDVLLLPELSGNKNNKIVVFPCSPTFFPFKKYVT